MRGDTWDAAIQTLPEWQCRPHMADYIWRGPSNLRISKEVDPASRTITAFHAEWLRSVDRVDLPGWPAASARGRAAHVGRILDREMGRRHPHRDDDASEGRLSAPQWPSAQRQGDARRALDSAMVIFSTVAAIVTDPVYLAEPFIRTTDYELDVHQQVPPYPCGVVAEVDRPRGVIPHLLPGTNPYLHEFSMDYGIPSKRRAAVRRRCIPNTARS